MGVRRRAAPHRRDHRQAGRHRTRDSANAKGTADREPALTMPHGSYSLREIAIQFNMVRLRCDKCGRRAQASPHFRGVVSNKRIKKAENLSEKNRNPPIDGEDRHERPERVEYWLTV